MPTLTKTRRKKIASDRANLRHFLREAVMVMSKIDECDSISWIINSFHRTLSIRGLEIEMTADIRESGMYEFRLNDAGFKLYMSASIDGIRGLVGGDQKDSNPEAYLILTMLLRQCELLPDNRFEGRTYPLDFAWFKENWEKLSPKAREWVKAHVELIPPYVIMHIGTAIDRKHMVW